MMSGSFFKEMAHLVFAALVVVASSACKDEKSSEGKGATVKDWCEVSCDYSNLCSEDAGVDKQDCSKLCDGQGSEAIGDGDCQAAFDDFAECLDNAKTCADGAECSDESQEVVSACDFDQT